MVLDIETSGLDTGRNGIWQIGALEFENPSNQFLQESRIDDEDEIMPEALGLTGKTEADLRSKDKQSQKQLIINYLEWCGGLSNNICVGHNIGFDLIFLQNKCLRYGLMDLFKGSAGIRSFDLHTVAQFRHREIDGDYSLREDGRSNMSLSEIVRFCGISTERKKLIGVLGVSKEGTPHNALEDAKLTAECFSRLMYEKNLLEEFKGFPAPDYLRK